MVSPKKWVSGALKTQQQIFQMWETQGCGHFYTVTNWVLVGISTNCIFFNTRVFYHPGGDFYTMVLQNTKKYNKNKKANRRPG
jgi:hypothetical protein